MIFRVTPHSPDRRPGEPVGGVQRHSKQWMEPFPWMKKREVLALARGLWCRGLRRNWLRCNGRHRGRGCRGISRRDKGSRRNGCWCISRGDEGRRRDGGRGVGRGGIDRRDVGHRRDGGRRISRGDEGRRRDGGRAHKPQGRRPFGDGGQGIGRRDRLNRHRCNGTTGLGGRGGRGGHGHGLGLGDVSLPAVGGARCGESALEQEAARTTATGRGQWANSLVIVTNLPFGAQTPFDPGPVPAGRHRHKGKRAREKYT